MAHSVAFGNRLLHRVPPCRWWYRRQFERGLVWTRLVVPAGAGLDGLRAVFLSDVHLGSYLVADDVRRLLDAVVSLQPELVLLGGDLVHTRASELATWTELLAPVRDRVPHWFAVPGNHERFPGLGIDRFRRALASAGVTLLLDRGERIRPPGATTESLWVAGIDDLAEGEPDPERALAGRGPAEQTLVLSHHPDCFDDLAGRVPAGALVLSGHTHGGQIAPWGRVLMRHSGRGYHRGLHRIGTSALYVGRGVGAAILPLRIGAAPEVVVVDWSRSATAVEVDDTAVGLANAGSPLR